MSIDLPSGWIWASVTRLRREYIRADQLDAPYASTRERRADLNTARRSIAEEAAAIVEAQHATLSRPAAPRLHVDQFDMFAGLAPAQLAIERRPYQECKQHGTFYNPKCYHCRRRRPDRPHRAARKKSSTTKPAEPASQLADKRGVSSDDLDTLAKL